MSNQPGLSLADLAAMTEDVPIGTSTLKVQGISTKNALAVFQRFPQLAKMADGFKISDIIVVAPGALAAIIAAGVGKLGDEEAEEQASQIALETQFDIVEAIGRLTFKSGFAPFAQRLLKLADVARSGNFTKVPSTNLPATSKPSSQPDTIPPVSGDTPLDK